MVAIATTACVLGHVGYNAIQNSKLSTVMKANVEALCDDEDSSTCRWKRTYDSFGCLYHVCIKTGDGNVCECGSVAD
jgi:hypothetical protein